MSQTSILIVEDEQVIALETELTLRGMGYFVPEAVDNGDEAIQRIQKLSPDLVLMDIRIKGDKDGIETAKIIRERFKIPVIFVTAFPDDDRVERAKAAMPFGYLLKPINPRELRIAIEMALYVAENNRSRLEAEKALKESEHRFASHIRNTPVAVIDFNMEREIVSWNAAASEMLGYSEEEVQGKKVMEWLIPSYEQARAAELFFPIERKPVEGILDVRTRGGRIITCQWFNTPVSNLEGDVIALSSICRDITDKVQAERALREKLISLTQPSGEVEDIQLDDLFDLAEIQKLQDQFAKATGVASIITNPNGIPITSPSNFCRLCSDIIRKTDKGRNNCYRSDAFIGRYNPEGPIVQPCMSGGLWDAGAAISVGGKHIGNWLIGQIRDETRDLSLIESYAREIGADVAQAVEAYKETPAMSYEKFRAISDMLFTLANQLSSTAFQNLQQARMIARQQQAEEDLLESQEKYKTLIENAKDAIVVLQREVIQYFNPNTARLTGYQETELAKMPFLRLIHPKDQEMVLDYYVRRQNGEVVKSFYTFRLTTKTGVTLFCEIKSVIINWENEVATLCFISDITERVRLDIKRRESDKKYRDVVENATIAICVVRDDRFVFFNPEMAKMLEYPPEELQGKLVEDVVYPDDFEMVSQFKLDNYAGKTIVQHNHRVVTKNQSIRWVDAKSVAIEWQESEAILVFLTDITERKMTEEMMIRSDKMVSLGSLAAGVAHELNNPLGAMLQGIQNVRNRLDPKVKSNYKAAQETQFDLENAQRYLKKRKINETLEKVQESGIAAGQIISGMLRYSRQSDSILSNTNLHILIQETLDLAGKNYDIKKQYDFKKIKIDLDVTPNLPKVSCVPNEIKQVLLNLLTNSACALTETGDRRDPQIDIIVRSNEEQVSITVADNGPGMDIETQKHIFEPFYTTKPKGTGTGLGLWVSYMIITKNHKGTMKVSSEIGKGTRFIIELPLVKNHPAD